MKAVLQRVAQARVDIAGRTVGEIGAGLLVLLCAERGDSDAAADRMLAKMLKPVSYTHLTLPTILLV